LKRMAALVLVLMIGVSMVTADPFSDGWPSLSMEDKAMMITGFTLAFSFLADEDYPMSYLSDEMKSATKTRMFAISQVFSHVDFMIDTIDSIIESGESDSFMEIMLLTLTRAMKRFNPGS